MHSCNMLIIRCRHKENMIKMWVYLWEARVQPRGKFLVYILCFVIPLITLQNNRQAIWLRNSKKKLRIFPIVKDGDISPGRKYHYEKIYIHNNAWKFCGDHILIKFFFWCIIEIQKNFKKKWREPVSLKADK